MGGGGDKHCNSLTHRVILYSGKKCFYEFLFTLGSSKILNQHNKEDKLMMFHELSFPQQSQSSLTLKASIGI